MRKLLWIPACLVLFFIGDRLGGTMLSNIVAESQFRYAKLYRGQAQSDILLLGNSRGLIFYQPYIEKITGQSTFNLSYNSLPVDLGRAMVADYFNTYEPPKLLIIDVSLCDRQNTQLIAGFNTFSSFSGNLDKLIKEKAAKSWYGGQLSHLFRYNNEVFQRTLYYWKKSDKDWLNDRVISSTMQENVKNETVYELTITDYLLEELDQLIRIAEEKGTQVELVINPYYPAYFDRMKNFKQFIDKIETKTNRKVRDYSKILSETTGFADYQHLNKEGSKQYLDILQKDGVLP